MHLANIIVSARALLAESERHYAGGLIGSSSESLAELANLIVHELPGALQDSTPPADHTEPDKAPGSSVKDSDVTSKKSKLPYQPS